MSCKSAYGASGKVAESRGLAVLLSTKRVSGSDWKEVWRTHSSRTADVRRTLPGCSAFTLVEVMVALAIVAIGMLASFSAVNQIVSDTIYLRDKTLADWIGMNLLTDIRLEGGLPDLGKNDGEVEFAEQNWLWETRVSETPVESLRRIEVDVALANEPDTVLITLYGFAGGALNLQTLGSPWLTGVPGPQGVEGPVPQDPGGE